MKRSYHIVIIAILVILVFLLYGDGFGAIPFLLAAIYFGIIGIKELRHLNKSKRL
ncbi:hypothetical protein MKY34_00275 [Sporosarcina sp. FSL K6-1522]|uniref:hypothetical protein n=1 Tax=Sporosarcina sp. FSL K6-1522 TaxID=2921554 RepID=UPI00315A2983